jgi:integrase
MAPDPGGTGRFVEMREKAPTEEKAQQLLRDRIHEARNHRKGVRQFQGPAQDRVLLRDLLDALLVDQEMKGRKGLVIVRGRVARLKEYFGGARAVAVTSSLVKRYVLDRQKQKAKPATIDRETEILGRAFRLAAEEGRIAFVPVFPRLLKKHENARQGFLSRETFRAIVGQVGNPDSRDFLLWFYSTGMRQGEIGSLRWVAFDRESWTIRLAAKDAKTGKPRVIAVEGELRAVMERRLAARAFGCDLIFHRAGRAMDSKSVRRHWHLARGKAKVAPCVPYDLRRTAVRNMVRAGVPEKIAMAISGHRTRDTFDRYNIVNEDDVRAAILRTQQYVEGLPAAEPDTSAVAPMREA